MNWVFLPPWGMRALVAGALVLVVLLTLRALRERRTVSLPRQVISLVMRVFLIAILCWILLNPTLLETRKSEGKPALTLLLDTSYSMSTRDVGGKGRLESALEILKDEKTRSRLERDFTLDVRRFDRTVSAASLMSLDSSAAQGRTSDIGAALSSAVGEMGDRKDQAGVLLISDGRVTTEGALEAARLALARSVPLWTWCLGGDVPRRDLWIQVPNSEVLAFSDAEVELRASLHAVGYDPRIFTVQVLRAGEVIGTLEATPDESGQAQMKFKVNAPASGEERYVFRAVEQDDEAEKQNNERSVFVRAVGKKVRVLVVEGQPHWDTKFLVQCLKRNDRVDVTAINRLRKDREFTVLSEGTSAKRESADLFPRTAQDFEKYDVIIMGRSCETFFDDHTEELLTDFVARRGGGLIFSRGKPYAGRFPALSKFEPVVWGTGVVQGVRLVTTDATSEGPVFELRSPKDLTELVDRLPRFDQISYTVGVKPLAVVLAQGLPEQSLAERSSIVMAYQLYGQGRVVTLNASGLWRWSFRDKEKPEDEFVYDEFWSGLLRWMLSGSDFLAGHDIALRADRRLCTDEEPMQFLVRTRGLEQDAYRPKLTIEGPDTSTEVEPRRQAGGNYVAQAGPFPPGTYQVRLRNNIGQPPELAMTIEVVSASVENRILSADPVLMKRLAELSEGRTLDADDVPNMGDILRQWQAQKQLAEEKHTLWDRWWLLTVALAILGVEWFSRRREGLL